MYKYPIFKRIVFEDSLRGDPDALCVFINLLLSTDADGMVEKTPEVIAAEIGIRPERVITTLMRLESPDPDAMFGDDDGRRIIGSANMYTPWRWQIIDNIYEEFETEARREQNRRRQQRFRERQKEKRMPPPNG